MRTKRKKYLFRFTVFLAVVSAVGITVLTMAILDYRNHAAGSQQERVYLIERRASIPIPDVTDDALQDALNFHFQMREINPDFVAWITIEGTNIDYPVVRGRDNIRYLNTSFLGEENRFGTLFMDYRNVGAFIPHIIIYGHNTQDGSKFSELLLLLDDNFMRENNTIILWLNGRALPFTIFSARVTDIHDPAYFLDFNEPNAFYDFLLRNNAPPDARQIITLSTCVDGAVNNVRMVVQGVLW